MVVAGNWSRNGQEITVEPGICSRVVVPVTVSGSYDFEVDFTRTSGGDCICTLFPVGSHSCRAILSGWDGRASGLDLINGHLANDPGNLIAVRPGNLENGRRYRLLVSARVDSEDHASVDVLLDGKPYLPRWAGDPAALVVSADFSIPNSSGLGLSAWQCGVTFHSARLKMISGSASLDSALISANN
jgi:hypothetical protein